MPSLFCQNFFYREIDGVIYPGNVKEKEEARKQYDRAKKRGQSAGLISKKYMLFNSFYFVLYPGQNCYGVDSS